MPENPGLLSLGMNGTWSEAKASHLHGMKPRPLGRGVFIKFSFKQWEDSKLDSYNILCQASFVLMIIAAQFSYDIPRNGLLWVFGGILLAERAVEMGK